MLAGAIPTAEQTWQLDRPSQELYLHQKAQVFWSTGGAGVIVWLFSLILLHSTNRRYAVRRNAYTRTVTGLWHALANNGHNRLTYGQAMITDMLQLELHPDYCIRRKQASAHNTAYLEARVLPYTQGQIDVVSGKLLESETQRGLTLTGQNTQTVQTRRH